MPVSLQSCLNFFAPLGFYAAVFVILQILTFIIQPEMLSCCIIFSSLFKIFLSSVSMRCMLDFVFHLFLTACTVCFYSSIIKKKPLYSLLLYF